MERVQVLGILGGIGCGKSTIGALFADRGAVVLDADRSAHAAFADPAVKSRIAARFDGVLDARGEVDRGALGKIVFADSAARESLEAIVHPWVHEDLERRLQTARSDPRTRLVVLDVPLLLETGWDSACDALIYIDTPLAERERRVSANRGWSSAELARREAQQRPLEEKRARSAHVIDNSGPRADAARDVDAIFRRYATPPPPPIPTEWTGGSS